MKLENRVLQTLTQQQKLSLKQQFDLKILEMNTQDILSYIENEVESNPLLEYDDAYETSPIYKKDTSFDLLLNYVEQDKSLSEELEEQIDTYPKPILHDLALFLANSLDSNGYLPMQDEEILTLFPQYTLDDIEDTIHILQTFEPAGIAARSLQECLLIQLCFEEMPYSQVALMIVNFFLPLVAENKLPQIAKELEVSLEEIQHGVNLIRSLNPKPGSSYATSSPYVNPDVQVHVEDGEVTITLFHQTYGLKVHKPELREIDKTTKQYIQTHEKHAQQLVDGIEKRNSTLMRIVDAIVRYQINFFLHQAQLKPLNRKDIAEQLGIHESTVSRTIANKSMLFQQQNIPLKFFFPSKLGEDTSANEIHLQLRRLIDQENKKKPLSDQNLADVLQKEGYPVSRRTIAKYREQLKIPVASKRKVF